MHPPLATDDPKAVQVEVQRIHAAMYPDKDPSLLAQLFVWTTDCFAGRYRDYQAIDAGYHDLEHTLQGTLCLARLLHGRHAAGAEPATTEKMFRLAMLAILLHDSGYLKKRDDKEGTGAKYTITHVARSMSLAAELLKEKGLDHGDVQSVQNLIRCTGLNADIAAIPFQSELERILGAAIATADLLGQMAAEDYVEKLPALYLEFEEAVRFSGDREHFVARFTSAMDLMTRTPSFWCDFVCIKLDGELGGLYRFLNAPYPHGPNCYIDRVSLNMRRIQDTPVPPSESGLQS